MEILWRLQSKFLKDMWHSRNILAAKVFLAATKKGGSGFPDPPDLRVFTVG
jgi:hypothetical protein